MKMFSLDLVNLSIPFILENDMDNRQIKKNRQDISEKSISLLFEKLPFPYRYLTSPDVLNGGIPDREYFNNDLANEMCTDSEWQLVQDVCSAFNISTFRQFTRLYTIVDTLLLAVIWENFRMNGMRSEIEYIRDFKMIELLSKAIRGGFSFCTRKIQTANNERSTFGYDPTKNRTHLIYNDKVSLYATALLDKYPHSNYRWESVNDLDRIDWKSYESKDGKGYFLQVTLGYPPEVQDKTVDLPLAPERRVIKFEELGEKQQHNLSKLRYYDPSDSFLALTCRIVKQDGTLCDDNDIVAPSNLFFQTMFSNLEIYLNGQLVSDSGNYYSQIAYLQRLLASSPNEKQGKLLNEFYYPDEKPEAYSASDPGFAQRYEKTKKSQSFTMIGQLVANIFNQPRFLPAGTEIRILLRRNLPELCLTAAYDTKTGFNGCPYSYQITNATFFASKKVISKPIVDAHRHQLSLGRTFKYPTTEVELKTFTIAQGLTSITTDSVVIGKIPRILVVGLVSSTSFLGKLSKSPFNYVDKNICELGFTWNGETVEHRVFPFNFRKSSTAKVNGKDVIV
ncbi:unnamed protein product, partial [Allacma fusca]